MMIEMERDYAGRIIDWAFTRPETRTMSMPDLIQAYWNEQLNTTEIEQMKHTQNKSWVRVEAILTRYNIEAEDLIADIMHWCDEEDVYFDELLDVAKGYYLEEIEA